MRTFQRGETVEVYVEVKTQAGVLTAVTSIHIIITDPEGTEKIPVPPAATEDMAVYNAEDGKFVYYYTILDAVASIGWWRVEVTVTDVDKYTIVVGGFVAE